ncbi:PepSY domain-containing protein [Clostridium massiliamazoniense]|uniref:PepSY domain-containing protein n=1 Tax=Clostridium massiliamazoniense TaxID=1347366 RepID=UPI0006D7B7DC|nr:PepSY domain-containing protein [Clostridium massiliamazoniense]
MIKKVFLALTGILIVCDLIFIGVSFTSKSTPAASSNSVNPLYSSNNDGVSPTDVRTIVENKAKGGIVTSLTFDQEKKQYDVKVDTLNDTYSAVVNATNGDIISFKNDDKKPNVDLDITPTSSTTNGANFIPASKAVEILNKEVPDGTINELTYNIVGITPQYDSTITKDNTKYYVDINATTGSVISKYSEPLSKENS